MSLFALLVDLARTKVVTEKTCDKCRGQISRQVVDVPGPPIPAGYMGIMSAQPNYIQWQFQCTGCSKTFSMEEFDAL